MRDFKPVLLVEDDTVDAMSAQKAFKDLNVANRLSHHLNGEEALTYLREPDTEFPCLILLDINMPKMNGLEFLQQIKQDESLKHIPVVMLTTSREDVDINESFRLSAAGYIVKPVGYKSFVEAIHSLDMYWTLCELPDLEKGIGHENPYAAFAH